MTIPLVVLAIGSVLVGYFSVPHFLEPIVGKVSVMANYAQERFVMIISIIAGISGIMIAWYMYIVKPQLPERLAKTFQRTYKVLWNKYYVDEAYSFLFVKPTIWFADKFIERFTDIRIIEGIVNGIPKLCYNAGLWARRIHKGYLQQYAIFMIIGICIFILILLSR